MASGLLDAAADGAPEMNARTTARARLARRIETRRWWRLPIVQRAYYVTDPSLPVGWDLPSKDDWTPPGEADHLPPRRIETTTLRYNAGRDVGSRKPSIRLL